MEFDNSIRLGRQLMEVSEPDENELHSMAASYNNLGVLHDTEQPILANEAFANAKKIGRQLVKANPMNRLYQADLARTYSNQGLLSSRMKEWKNAKQWYGDAIKIQEELAKSSPFNFTYRRDLAVSYNNLGMALYNVEQLADAGILFHKSIGLQDELLERWPNDAEVLSYQGSAWNNLGLLYDRQRQYSDGEKAYQQAIANQRRALDATKTNARYRALLSQYFINSARNLFSQTKYDAAVQMLLERKQLWPGQPEKLYSVAQQLAALYGQMRAKNAPAPSQSSCAQSAVATLREALAAGLPNARLKDPKLAALTGTHEYQQLLSETTHANSAPSASNQAAISDAASQHD